jgi:ubiquinone/menaquinone biosynthesis C-methylase UbiE
MMNPAEFANIAESEANFWWYRGMRRIMFGLLDPVAKYRTLDRVLEAGCGTGHFARELERRYRWRMYSLDLGMEGLRYARAYGLERLVQADIRQLPYGDRAFDAVVSMDVIVHLPRGEESVPLAEFARVLRPGGLLAIRVSALEILRSRHSEHAMERQRFNRRRLIAAVRERGFEIERVTYANSLLMPVALAKFRIWEPLTGQATDSGVKPVAPWLDSLLHAPLAAEAKWIGAGLGFPAGQSLILLANRVS